MYICNNCDTIFEKPDTKKIYFEDYYKISEIMHSRTPHNLEICPYCKDDDIEELVVCDGCGEWYREDELHDTEGRLNGGIGYVCEQCLEDFDIRG